MEQPDPNRTALKFATATTMFGIGMESIFWREMWERANLFEVLF